MLWVWLALRGVPACWGVWVLRCLLLGAGVVGGRVWPPEGWVLFNLLINLLIY